MSQSQENNVPELVTDEDAIIDTTPPAKDATSEVANQGPSSATATAASAVSAAATPAKPQKPKKRAYTKRGGASSEAKVQDESDEDEVCFFNVMIV